MVESPVGALGLDLRLKKQKARNPQRADRPPAPSSLRHGAYVTGTMSERDTRRQLFVKGRSSTAVHVISPRRDWSYEERSKCVPTVYLLPLPSLRLRFSVMLAQPMSGV